jgi:hypothetical protein
MGHYKNGSDVDLVLMGDVSQSDVSRISGYLNDEANTPYFYDVVGYELCSNKDLIDHIDRFAKPIYTRAS